VTATAGGRIGIVELVEVCASMSARNRRLFERLGAWVADEPDPTLQRWFAVATHRHAWHAELWDGRRPAIPVDAPHIGRPADGDPDDRAGWYRAELATMRSDVAALARRIDPVLDPSTQRVIDLVRADVDDLDDLNDLDGVDGSAAQAAPGGG
jgi:hypothetical protein